MPEAISCGLLPDGLRKLLQGRVGRPQRAAEIDDPRVEEVVRVVLAPLVVVEARDPPELVGDLVRVRHRLGLTRSARLERELAALEAERVDAARLGYPQVALLGDLVDDERGADRATVVRVAVVVDTPELRVALAARVLQEHRDPLEHALLVAHADRLARITDTLVEQVGTADAAVAA